MKHTVHDTLPASVHPSWRIGIVASQWHADLVERMVEGARAVLMKAGIPPEHIEIHHAAGSFEIPLIGAALAHANRVDAMLGFGIIVKGETHHARLLADAVVHGMMDVQIRSHLPFAFEVLYVDHMEDAVRRTEGPDNKGIEAARSVLWSLSTLQAIRSKK